ncbi:TAXI family TRAP transporter solute-binding subunit [Actinomadura nitritigenes]|uniref:TAXI family TRAP transporter solute-binding subunit n=1 Tax=Actinomadura nitritigenes TaxID=134602 RepID=UPI0036794BA8
MADLKLLCPGGNFTSVGGLIAHGLARGGLPRGSTVSVVTGTPYAELALNGPDLVRQGRYQAAITTPAWHLAGQDGVRTLASLAHDDQLVLAVRKRHRVRSLHDVRERRLPLKISMPTRESGHPAAIALERLFSLHGFTVADLEAWGGRILHDRPKYPNQPESVPVDPAFDAVFDEAVMTWRWKRISETYDLDYLPVEDGILARCAELGMRPGVLRAGRLRGVERDVPTIDFSGWVLYCAEDLPDATARLMLEALDEQKEQISGRFTGPTAAMTSPIDMRSLPLDPPVPLHPGAAAFYKENGYL